MIRWYNDLGFRWKLTLPLLVLVVIFIGVSVYAMRAATAMSDNANTIASVNLTEIQLLMQADRDLYQALTAERAMLMNRSGRINPNALYREHQENAQQVYERTMQSFELSRTATANEREMFDQFYQQWLSSSTDIVNRARTADASLLEQLTEQSFGEGMTAFNRLREYIDEISEHRLQQAESLNEQIENEASAMISVLSLAGLIGTLVSLSVVVCLPMLVTRPLNDISARLADIAEGEGDLTLRLNLERRDELGQLAGHVNRFMERLQHLVGDIRSTTESVATSTGEMVQASASSRQAVDDQSLSINMVVVAVNELTAAIHEVAQNTNETADNAKQANATTEAGRERLNRAVDRVNDLSEYLENASHNMQKLEEDARNVTSVIEVIRGVAEQTNLLALNAAIEAARAGEQGRGFAVVADEVRTLASRTQQSTEDIRSMLTRLQGGVQEAVDAMAASREMTAEAVESAGEAGNALAEISVAVQRITEMAIQIATAAEEQSAVTADIDKNMVEIHDLATRTSEDAAVTTSASEHLSSLATRLQEMVVRFRV